MRHTHTHNRSRRPTFLCLQGSLGTIPCPPWPGDRYIMNTASVRMETDQQHSTDRLMLILVTPGTCLKLCSSSADTCSTGCASFWLLILETSWNTRTHIQTQTGSNRQLHTIHTAEEHEVPNAKSAISTVCRFTILYLDQSRFIHKMVELLSQSICATPTDQPVTQPWWRAFFMSGGGAACRRQKSSLTGWATGDVRHT